jgi:pimeloyl-ACP methyl ester carboxylesterase
MNKEYLWTASRARLQLVHSSEERNLNWLFLPGGPGLGSESLFPLLNILELPGNMWRLDLPGDGSNTTANSAQSFSRWSSALIEAVNEFDQIVLVAHSTGGMFALSVPEIEGFLHGLVLLDSAPNAEWQTLFAEMVEKFPIPKLAILQKKYKEAPSNEVLKALTVASAPYLFTPKGQAFGLKMLNSLPYNYEVCQWSEKHFDHSYRAKWVPQTVPTLILNGEGDLVTPQKLFTEGKEWHRSNIIFKLVMNAGHFPWIENPMDVVVAFKEFCALLDS